MVLIAFAIAAPLASYGIENWWLANFAYRTNIQLWSIFFSGFTILLLAWLTVLGQTIKAAKTNPIDCLRNE
jgi:putative ABC transport system permease protein